MPHKFTNEAQPRDLSQYKYAVPGSYGFSRVPRLLFSWSRLFQRIISQAGTYLLTGKFHDHDCGIHKVEGGCHINGVDDLVLLEDACDWDFDHGKNEQLRKVAALITEVVLTWDPNDAVDSMLNAAAKHIGTKAEVLKAAVDKSDCGGVFGGNALADFFHWNPFSEPPIDREYERYCLLKHNGMTSAEVDQKYADQDLGKDLLERMRVKTQAQDRCGPYPMCCSPRRMDDGTLKFWVNTGTSTKIDGWQTAAELEAFIASAEKLVRERR